MKKAVDLNTPLEWICLTTLSMTLLSLRLLEGTTGLYGPTNKIIQLGVCWIGYLSSKSGNKSEAMELDENGWRLRYELERELEEIYTYRESIWQKRCSERWILQGDANTVFSTALQMGGGQNAPYSPWKQKRVKFLKQHC
jgi:hypothetical protein